ISHAVDVAEITRNRFLTEFEVKDIEIGTEVVENENRKSNVSAISITLGKKS
ncbi:MAG: RNA-binding protein, partial [Candidatus Wukongarchaeota archaeon]|nr:RNA-binding protein [Candidatus Wukongarchaeota archaeon]